MSGNSLIKCSFVKLAGTDSDNLDGPDKLKLYGSHYLKVEEETYQEAGTTYEVQIEPEMPPEVFHGFLNHCGLSEDCPIVQEPQARKEVNVVELLRKNQELEETIKQMHVDWSELLLTKDGAVTERDNLRKIIAQKNEHILRLQKDHQIVTQQSAMLQMQYTIEKQNLELQQHRLALQQQQQQQSPLQKQQQQQKQKQQKQPPQQHLQNQLQQHNNPQIMQLLQQHNPFVQQQQQHQQQQLQLLQQLQQQQQQYLQQQQYIQQQNQQQTQQDLPSTSTTDPSQKKRPHQDCSPDSSHQASTSDRRSQRSPSVDIEGIQPPSKKCPASTSSPSTSKQ